MNRAHLISRAAYAGLVALLCVLVTLAVTAAFVTKRAASDAARAVARSDLFSSIRFDVGAEESLHRAYELEPGSETLHRHADAAVQLVKKLVTLNAESRRASGGLVDTLLVAHRRYLTATHLLFTAIDNRNPVRARAIDHLIVDRAFGAFQATVEQQARQSTQLAHLALRRLRRTEDVVIVLTIIVSFIALLVLGVILMILRHYKQQVDAAISSEMNGLKQAALTDHLTGLGNHRAYQEDLHNEQADWRSNGRGLTIALIDVDEFKTLNDRHGHVTGDNLLTSLAKVLRAGDLHSIPYRLGGDEFALTFPGMPLEAARERMEHVRRVVEADLGGTTVSIGLATSRDAETDLLLLREQADSALYEAKRRGRNSVVTFDDIRDETAIFLPARVAEVRDLIADGTMGVAFQPIWDTAARRVIGYEALARPAGIDPINPQDAFDIAERIGKAHDLDRICRAAVLARAHTLPADALLFINVSPQSLDHEQFVGRALIAELEAVGLTPDRIVLEITERSIARLPIVVREAKRLRALGFALALDDAGSGNSGLEMLSQLAVDYVKVDREVIVQALSGSGGRAVLAGIIAIAQEMQAQIIAEGIEDGTMLELVRNATRWSSIPCAVQGYYLGRPNANVVDDAEFARVQHRLAPQSDGSDTSASGNVAIETLLPAAAPEGRRSTFC